MLFRSQATACVWCGVAPGQPCVRLGTTELRTAPHATRIETAVLVAQAREAGKAEAEFGPLGDNHHNATRCPYCTPTIDAKRAQSAAELLDQFLTALDSWATDGGWSRVYSAAELRWFAEQWLPSRCATSRRRSPSCRARSGTGRDRKSVV